MEDHDPVSGGLDGYFGASQAQPLPVVGPGQAPGSPTSPLSFADAAPPPTDVRPAAAAPLQPTDPIGLSTDAALTFQTVPPPVAPAVPM
nr:hypothetical protein [Actinomycetota bacterium]